MSVQEQAQPADQMQAEIAAAAARESAIEHNDSRNRLIRGLGMAAIGLAAAGAIAAGVQHEGDRLSHEMPFVHQAQTVIEEADKGFEAIGIAGAVLTASAIGAVKIGARRSTKLAAIDTWSGKELVDKGHSSQGIIGRAVRNTPWVAAAGVALGTLTAGVSSEVGNGPERPIDAMFTNLAPGVPIVQYKEAMPMVQSNVNNELTARVQKIATQEGVKAHILDLNLGAMNYGNQTYTDLSAGIEMPKTSPAAWSPEDGCKQIPVMIDKAAHIPVGATVELNGVEAKNVGTVSGNSAMNRIGVVMDNKALETCLEQDANAPHHAITLETTPAKAQAILAEANQGLDAPATVDSVAEYKKQSSNFWNANVKPITSLQEMAASAMVLVALGGAMGERLLRNRAQWADKLANGVSASQLRATELLRSAKQGMKASMVGVAAGVVPTIGAGMLESGFQPGVGAREALIGAGVGFAGTVLGGASRLIRLNKTIDVEEHTRA